MALKNIDSGIWMHKRFKKLPPNAKLLYLYCCVNHRMNQAGIMDVSINDIAHDTGLPEVAVELAFIELEDLDIEWDKELETVWVKNHLEYQAHSPTYLKAVAKCLDNIDNKAFIDRFLANYKGKRNHKGMPLNIPYAYPTDTLPPTLPITETETVSETETETDTAEVLTVFEFWNKQNIIQHQKLTDKMKRAIKTAMKDYSVANIMDAMHNYGEIVNKPLYFFKYKWTLVDFLKRGIEKFIDGEVARNNYKNNKSTVGGGDTGEWKFR